MEVPKEGIDLGINLVWMWKDWVSIKSSFVCHAPAISELLFLSPCDLLLQLTSMHQNHFIEIVYWFNR